MPRLLFDKIELLPENTKLKSDCHLVFGIHKQEVRTVVIKKKYKEPVFHFEKDNNVIFVSKMSSKLSVRVLERKLLKKPVEVAKLVFSEKFLTNVKYDEETKMKVKLATHDSKNPVEFIVFFTMTISACPHSVTSNLHNFQIKGDCCTKFFGCVECHDSTYRVPDVVGKKKTKKKMTGEEHKLGKIVSVKCMKCCIEQPFAHHKCLCCSLKFGEKFCYYCQAIIASNDFVHCYECGKCIEEPKTHEHFPFLYPESDIRKQIEKVNAFVNDLDFTLFQLLFTKDKDIGMNIQLLKLFCDKRLPRSTVLQITLIGNLVKKFLDKGGEEAEKNKETLLGFVAEISKLKELIDIATKRDVNIRKRNIKLARNKILRLMKFINFKKIMDRRAQYEIEKKKEEDEMREDFSIIWKPPSRITENAEFDEFYKKFETVKTLLELQNPDLVRYYKKFIAGKLFDEIHFMERRETVTFHYVCSKVCCLIYGVKKNMKYFQAHAHVEIEKEILGTYQEISSLDHLQKNLIIISVIIQNFNINQSDYLKFFKYKLEMLYSELKENQIEANYTHVETVNKLINQMFRVLGDNFTKKLQRKFHNVVVVLEILKLLQNIHQCLITIDDSSFTQFFYVKIKKMDFVFYLREQIEFEKEKELAEMTEKGKSTVEIFKTSYVLHSLLDKFKEMETQGINKKFLELFNVDFSKAFVESIAEQISKLVINLGKTLNENMKDVSIEIFRGLFPICFDLKKYGFFKDVNLLEVFKHSLDFSFNKFRTRMEGWVNRCIEKEDFQPISPEIGRFYSGYCKSVVEIVFQPVDLVFEVDTVHRESAEEHKESTTSYLDGYFVIIREILHLYADSLRRRMELFIIKMLNVSSLQEQSPSFLNFLKKVKSKNVQVRKIKNEDFDRLMVMCNNINGAMRLAINILNDDEFEELVTTFNLEIEDPLKIPALKNCIKDLREIRSNGTLVISELLFLECYGEISELLSGKVTKRKEFEKNIDLFCDNLNDRFSYLVPRMYPIVGEMVLKSFCVKVTDFVCDLIFNRNTVMDDQLLQNFTLFFIKFTALLNCDGEGLKEMFLGEQKKRVLKFITFFTLPIEELKKMYEKKQEKLTGFYILKALQLRGGGGGEFAKTILPEDSLKEKRMSKVIMSAMEFNKKNSYKLFVTLISASNLPAMDSNGFSDPYVVFSLAHKGEEGQSKSKGGLRNLKALSRKLSGSKLRKQIRRELAKSTTKMKTLNPQWDEKYIFSIDNREGFNLVIECFDYDKISKDDFIGSVTISMMRIKVGKDMEKSFKLKRKKKFKTYGSVKLKLKLLKS